MNDTTTEGTEGSVSPIHRRRVTMLGVLFGLLAATYVGRGAYLQVEQAEHWQEVARTQHAAKVELPAVRGGIYDRNDRPLAVEDRRFRAFLAPTELRDQDEAVSKVREVLGLSAAEARRLRRAREGWIAIPRRLTPAERDRLSAAVRRGLHFEALTSREHPEGDLALSLLGRVSDDGSGRSGLELALDSVLTGRPGRAMRRVDALGGRHPLPGGEISAPRAGHRVLLTLDARLQTIAENALDRGLERTGAAGGDIVLLDVRTGEVLALASRRAGTGPGAGVPAFTDSYEPGSTAKPFLLASLLEDDAARLDEEVYAEEGRFRIAGRTIEDVHPHDTLSVAEVIQYSSNIGAAKLSGRLTPGQQYRYLRDFGFGTPTGVMYPSESSGLLRKPDRWTAQSQASLAMGYELGVTSIQLAAAYGALADDGRLRRPYLVKEIRNPEGETVWRQEPRVVRQVVSPAVARSVTEVLARVVEGGTATRVSMKTLRIAGKTGTARLTTDGRYSQRRYAASFVGYTPAEDPRLLILTRLVDPQGQYYGGLTAAPVSRSTLEAALAARGVAVPRRQASSSTIQRVRWNRPDRASSPSGRFLLTAGASDDPPASTDDELRSGRAGGSAGARRSGASRVLPDLEGLAVREAVRRLHELGLHVRPDAVGRVRASSPPAGASVAPGDTVVLR